ncbi:CopG family transcriptional regulator [Streptomyces noursei]|uniref:CopG family transcriptional regulator n=1 Tax=Streptomyces noursei TaxID=1971 RepID=UPI0038262721
MSVDGQQQFHSLDRKVGRLETDLDLALSDIRSKLSRVEEAVDELEDLPRRVDSLESDVREATEETERVEGELEERIADAEGNAERLGRRIAALERRLRQADGAVVVDLDQGRGGELHALAPSVDAAHGAQSELLENSERSRLKLAGEQLRQTLADRTRHRTQVLCAAEVLATTQAGDPRREAAETDLKVSAAKAHEAHSRVDALQKKEAENRAKLEADEALYVEHAAVIEKGRRAETHLRMRMRSRISDALADGDLLPVWYVTALGPMAPSRNANDWLDAATDVLAY